MWQWVLRLGLTDSAVWLFPISGLILLRYRCKVLDFLSISDTPDSPWCEHAQISWSLLRPSSWLKCTETRGRASDL